MAKNKNKTEARNAAILAIANKAVDLGLEDYARVHLEVAQSGGKQMEMSTNFMRRFAEVYLKSMNAFIKITPYSVRYWEAQEDGVLRRDRARKIDLGSDYGIRQIFREFERLGPMRNSTDIDTREIGVCARDFLIENFGPEWRDYIRSALYDMYKYNDPFRSGYLSVKPGIKIKLVGRNLLVAANLKVLSYKNATLSIRDMPLTLKHAIVEGAPGRSLASLVEGLPDRPSFSETLAVRAQSSHAGVSITFDEQRVLIGTSDEEANGQPMRMAA